jgi:putative phage-type endonuclease
MANKTGAHKIGSAPTGSPEWFALRRGKMTGSRIASALGLSPWTSRFTLYYQMLGMDDGAQYSGPLEWGTRLEDAVIQKYADITPNVRVIRKPGVWQNWERPWQVASPDALIVGPEPGAWRRRHGNSLFEAKTAAYADDWGLTGSNEIPIWYRCQVLWYLDTFGYESAELGVLIGGNDYRQYVVEWNEPDAILLREAALAMVRQVELGIPPDLDGSLSTYETIQARHPEINGESIDIPEELAAAVHDVKVADRRAKSLTALPYVQTTPVVTLRKALKLDPAPTTVRETLAPATDRNTP